MSHGLNIIREPDEFCDACGLYKKCESPIMNGEGAEDADFLYVGEAPGGDEDEIGKPFQGRAGQLLREAIEEAGIDIRRCRFTNVVRCRPPKNDLKAYPDAIEHCRPHILREINAVRPKVVILLGNSAIKSVLNKDKITRLNGEMFTHPYYPERVYVAMVHPAYVLRNMEKLWMIKKALKEVKYAYKKAKAPKKSEPKSKHLVIYDRQMLKEFTDHLVKLDKAACDIEGSTLSPFDRHTPAELGCTGYCWEKGHSVCFPAYARSGEWGRKVKISPEEVIEALQTIAQSPLKHIFHFGKYDVSFSFMSSDIRYLHYWFDTGLASYTLDERKGIHGLDDWAWNLGYQDYWSEKNKYQQEHPESDPSKTGGNSNLVPLELLGPYNMTDTEVTWDLFKFSYKRLKEQGLYDMPFMFPNMYHNWTAMTMELIGVQLDLERNRELRGLFPEKISELDKKIRDTSAYNRLYDYKFRNLIHSVTRRVLAYKRPVPNPDKKIAELVKSTMARKKEKNEELVNLNGDDKRDLIYKFGGYKLRDEYKTDTGLPSVKMSVLEEMNKARPTELLQNVIDRSTWGSSNDKYVQPIPKWAGTDNRTHTSYLVHGQVTGRVSSEHPNHENLPKRADTDLEKMLVKYLRSQFTARDPEKYVLGEADEKQVEMRLFCDRAKDDKMTEEFNQGLDPHRLGAAAGFKVKPEEVTKEQRTKSKTLISFGLLYGRSAQALADSMGWSLEEAEEFIERYFSKYDDCYAYREEVNTVVERDKQVVSHFGRVRRLPEIDSNDIGTANEARRQAINSPIQGDASDITWCAGHRMQKYFLKYRFKSRVIIAVHDALYTDIYRKEMQDVVELYYKFMTDRKWIEKKTGWFCSIPLDIDISMGPNLGAMVELARPDWKTCSFVIPSELAA